MIPNDKFNSITITIVLTITMITLKYVTDNLFAVISIISHTDPIIISVV